MVKRKRKEASDAARFVLPEEEEEDMANEVVVVDEEAAEASRAGNKLLRKKKKRGVVYVARVPAYMKPAKLRYMLEQHGEVTNMYLTQEDERVRLRRKRAGGSKKPKFTEAWFEFKDRKVAKLVARSLNNTKLGAAAGSKSSFWHDNLWNIKYLSKFTWEHLTEKREHERHVREHRLRIELDQVRRDNEFFLTRVAQAKQLGKMEERKRKAGTLREEDTRSRRTFMQRTKAGGSRSKKDGGTRGDTRAKLSSSLIKALGGS